MGVHSHTLPIIFFKALSGSNLPRGQGVRVSAVFRRKQTGEVFPVSQKHMVLRKAWALESALFFCFPCELWMRAFAPLSLSFLVCKLGLWYVPLWILMRLKIRNLNHWVQMECL